MCASEGGRGGGGGGGLLPVKCWTGSLHWTTLCSVVHDSAWHINWRHWACKQDKQSHGEGGGSVCVGGMWGGGGGRADHGPMLKRAARVSTQMWHYGYRPSTMHLHDFTESEMVQVRKESSEWTSRLIMQGKVCASNRWKETEINCSQNDPNQAPAKINQSKTYTSNRNDPCLKKSGTETKKILGRDCKKRSLA